MDYSSVNHSTCQGFRLDRRYDQTDEKQVVGCLSFGTSDVAHRFKQPVVLGLGNALQLGRSDATTGFRINLEELGPLNEPPSLAANLVPIDTTAAHCRGYPLQYFCTKHAALSQIPGKIRSISASFNPYLLESLRPRRGVQSIIPEHTHLVFSCCYLQAK